MAAEMQEKFRMLLATKQEKPKIKIKSLDDINKEVAKECERNRAHESKEVRGKYKTDILDNFEMNLDVAVEIVGDNNGDVKFNDGNVGGGSQKTIARDRRHHQIVNGRSEKSKERRKALVDDDNEADTSDSDRLVIQDDEKPNPSLLHCLLLKVSVTGCVKSPRYHN